MNKKLFLPYVFTFTAWEMAMTTSRQRSILKIEKSVKVLSYGTVSLELFIFVPIFEFYFVTQSF